MKDRFFKVAGYTENKLRFHPFTRTGGIENGVGFAHGEEGGWVLSYKDFLQMAQLAKEARGSVKPQGWELDLLNKIAEVGLRHGRDLEGILEILDKKLPT